MRKEKDMEEKQGVRKRVPTDGVKSEQNADNELKRGDQVVDSYATEAHTETRLGKVEKN